LAAFAFSPPRKIIQFRSRQLLFAAFPRCNARGVAAERVAYLWLAHIKDKSPSEAEALTDLSFLPAGGKVRANEWIQSPAAWAKNAQLIPMPPPSILSRFNGEKTDFRLF
jgi:hypothetical protein